MYYLCFSINLVGGIFPPSSPCFLLSSSLNRWWQLGGSLNWEVYLPVSMGYVRKCPVPDSDLLEAITVGN